LLICYCRLRWRFSVLDWWQVCRRLWAGWRVVQSLYRKCYWILYNTANLSATLFNCISICRWILWLVCIVDYSNSNDGVALVSFCWLLQILCPGRPRQYYLKMTNNSEVGMIRVTWSILNFGGPNYVSVTAEARVIKFCTQVGHFKCYALMGVVGVMWPIFKFLGPNHIFGMVEARHFKFGVHIDIDSVSMSQITPKKDVCKVMWPLSFWESNW